MNLQPLGDRLIVEVLDEEELTVSGIVLPDTAREKPQRGRVLAVGPGARDEDGRSEEHTSELQSQSNLVCRLLLEKKKKNTRHHTTAIAHDTDTSLHSHQ